MLKCFQSDNDFLRAIADDTPRIQRCISGFWLCFFSSLAPLNCQSVNIIVTWPGIFNLNMMFTAATDEFTIDCIISLLSASNSKEYTNGNFPKRTVVSASLLEVYKPWEMKKRLKFWFYTYALCLPFTQFPCWNKIRRLTKKFIWNSIEAHEWTNLTHTKTNLN